jgi:polyhydroxybutyrate depolymerase
VTAQTLVLVLALTAGGSAFDTQDRTLEHNGKQRTYRLHVPRNFTKGKPAALVIVLHGFGANGKVTEVLTGFTPLADKHGFAVAYPDGLLSMWRFWEPDGPAAKTKIARAKVARADDVGFIDELIEQLIKEGVADRRRVFVTGISNGAYMTHRLACDLGDKIAAIAQVAGTMAKPMAESLKPPRAMPVVYFHGTEDKFIGADGTDLFSKRAISLSADDVAAWWAKHNGCSVEPEVQRLPDKSDDGLTVERKTFAAGKSGAPVIFYEIHGGGHTWPGGNFQPEALLGKSTRDINASDIIWEFFSKFTLPESTGE